MILKSIGLMSGTSMDGIDAALIITDGKEVFDYIENFSLEYSAEFKNALKEQELLVRNAKRNIALQDVVAESTRLHALAVKQLLNKASLSPKDVDVIGYHGQSLYHHPQEKITIQIGNGQALANLTKIKVVNNFRQKDIDNGGQGAPLAPIYHQALAKKMNVFPVAFINCGGIANISLINSSSDNDVSGFDTGPGNVLLDAYIRQKTNNKEFMDFNGKYGLQGSINETVLMKLNQKLISYLEKAGPKSLDPGDFQLIDDVQHLSMQDACATLAAFTAYSIASSFTIMPKLIVLAGGGWNNPVILKYLKHYLLEKDQATKIKTATELGFSSCYMEAELFAYLAARSFNQLPLTFPNITGCKSPTFGGDIYQIEH